MATTAIGMVIMVSVDGVAVTMMSGVIITIAGGESINVAIGPAPSIRSLIFTHNRCTLHHRLTMSHDAHRASVCIFRSIIVGKNLRFASQIS